MRPGIEEPRSDNTLQGYTSPDHHVHNRTMLDVVSSITFTTAFYLYFILVTISVIMTKSGTNGGLYNSGVLWQMTIEMHGAGL